MRVGLAPAICAALAMLTASAHAQFENNADWENNGGLFNISYIKTGWVKSAGPLAPSTTLSIRSADGLAKCEITERISATEIVRYARDRERVRKRYVVGAVKKDKFGGARVIKSEMAPGGVFRAEQEALEQRSPTARQVLIVFGIDLADASWDERILCTAARGAPKEKWREIDAVLSTLTVWGDRPFGNP